MNRIRKFLLFASRICLQRIETLLLGVQKALESGRPANLSTLHDLELVWTSSSPPLTSISISKPTFPTAMKHTTHTGNLLRTHATP